MSLCGMDLDVVEQVIEKLRVCADCGAALCPAAHGGCVTEHGGVEIQEDGTHMEHSLHALLHNFKKEKKPHTVYLGTLFLNVRPFS